LFFEFGRATVSRSRVWGRWCCLAAPPWSVWAW